MGAFQPGWRYGQVVIPPGPTGQWAVTMAVTAFVDAHYAFTKDKKFLRETAYPLMKGAAAFCVDWLVEKDGWLVTAPSVSPENTFMDDSGKTGSVSIATTMDISIIWDLFTNIIEASKELNTETASYRDMIMAKRDKLFPLHIGKKGNLQEWYKDWEDTDPHHRHVSHLVWFVSRPGNLTH